MNYNFSFFFFLLNTEYVTTKLERSVSVKFYIDILKLFSLKDLLQSILSIFEVDVV